MTTDIEYKVEAMVALITLSLLATMIFSTQYAPTADEMQASFNSAQKFYSSGAYDQAIERYQHIIHSRSRFLKADAVRVTVGDITAPLHEIAPYQIGNAHFKMAEEAATRAARTRDPAEQAGYVEDSKRLFAQAAEFFIETESLSSVPALQALARSQAVTCWYRMKEYERAVEDARRLIERYPESKYVDKAMYDIGWAYYDREDYPHSIEAFQELVERFSTGYRVNRSLFQIGEAYFKLERYGEAIPFYQRLVESQRIGQMSEREILLMKREKIAGLVDETSLELAAKALIRMGVCYEKTGAYDKAVEAFELVATQFAEERRLAEEAYLRQADMHYNRGDFDACIAVYRRAILAEDDPFRKARMQLLLANRYFDTEHYAEAVREYNHYRDNYEMRAAQAGLSVEGAGLKIARAWFREADRHPPEERIDFYRRAEAELRQTLNAYPGSDYEVDLRFNLALALQLQNDAAKQEEALELFRGVSEARDAQGHRKSALFQIARMLQNQKEQTEAAAVYRRLIAELGDEPEADIARFELGMVEREGGAWEDGVGLFLAVRAAAPLYARARLEAGQTLLQHGEAERAIQVFTEGLSAGADSALAAYFNYFLGAAHVQIDQQEAALPYFDAAAGTAGPELRERAIYGRGATRFRLGRFAAAIGDLAREWKDEELASSAPRLLAAAYTSLDRVDEALDIYRSLAQATGTDMERAEYLLALAEISYRKGRYRETLEACEDIQRLAAGEEVLPEGRAYYLVEKALFLSADASIRLDDFQGALTRAKAGLESYPQGFYAPDFLFLGGIAALQSNHPEVAAERFARMLERYPGHANAAYARYYLGYAFFNQTFFGKAIPFFRETVERFPELDIAPDAFFRVAECQYNLEQYEEAQQTYREVIAAYPDHELAEDALYNISWCVMNAALRGEQEEQTAALEEALSAYLNRYPHGRHVSTARYTLAEILFNAGDYARSYDLFRQIQTDYPGTVAAEEAADVLPQLREAIAFQDYSPVLTLFDRAIEEKDNAKLRAVLPQLEELWERYPDTSVGIGAKVNVGVCYQRLKKWEDAVAAYETVIAEGEKGNAQVTPNVTEFVQRRRDSIVRKHL